MTALFWQALTLLRGDRTNAQLAARALENGHVQSSTTVTALANYFCRIMNGRVPRVSVETAQKLATGLGYTSLSAFFLAFEDAERTIRNLSAQPFDGSVQNDVHSGKGRDKQAASKRMRSRRDDHEAQSPFSAQLDTLTRAIEADTQVAVEATRRAVQTRQRRTRLERAQQTLQRAAQQRMADADQRTDRTPPRRRAKTSRRR